MDRCASEVEGSQQEDWSHTGWAEGCWFWEVGVEEDIEGSFFLSQDGTKAGPQVKVGTARKPLVNTWRVDTDHALRMWEDRQAEANPSESVQCIVGQSRRPMVKLNSGEV